MTTTTQRGIPRVVIWIGNKLSGREDISKDVVQLSATKNLEAPAGQWSLTLMPRQSRKNSDVADLRRLAYLYRSIQLNNVVSIGFDEPGGIMIGLVDSIRRTTSYKGGQARQGLQITGSDLGKGLHVDNIIKASLAVQDLDKYLHDVAVALGPDHPILVDLPGTWGPDSIPTVEVEFEGKIGKIKPETVVPTFIGQSVQTVVDWILEHSAGMRIPLLAEATGGSGFPNEYIGTDFSITTWNDARIWSDTLHMYQGSTWNFIRGILDRDFYEVVIQTSPNGSALANVELVVRPKPFDQPGLPENGGQEWAPVEEDPGITWDSLRTFVTNEEYHLIEEHQIHNESLGVTDANTSSYYVVTAQHELIGNPDGLKEGLFYPMVDTYIAKHFGIRSYEARLALVGADVPTKLTIEGPGKTISDAMAKEAVKGKNYEDYDGEVGEQIIEFRNRLFNWNRLAPFYESGEITVHGADKFRPGDPVYHRTALPKLGDQMGLRFYCTAVQWSWSYGQHYTTTLQLTRGHNAGVIKAVKALIDADAPRTNPKHYAVT